METSANQQQHKIQPEDPIVVSMAMLKRIHAALQREAYSKPEGNAIATSFAELDDFLSKIPARLYPEFVAEIMPLSGSMTYVQTAASSTNIYPAAPACPREGDKWQKGPNDPLHEYINGEWVTETKGEADGATDIPE